eukprot:1803495-Rhodomonas_salina.1
MCTALANGADEILRWVFAHTTHHHGGAGAAYQRSYSRKCKELDGLHSVCWAAEKELSRWVATAGTNVPLTFSSNLYCCTEYPGTHQQFGYSLADLVHNLYWNCIGDVEVLAVLKATSALAHCHYRANPRLYVLSTIGSISGVQLVLVAIALGCSSDGTVTPQNAVQIQAVLQ